VSAEQELIGRCARGDELAFAELVEQHKVMVFNMAWRMLRDQDGAEDLSQEVFLRVYRSLPTFRGDAKLSTWIYQIAYRAGLEELQKPHRRQRYVSLDAGADELQAADPGPASVDLGQTLDYYLGKLPPHYRMALTLYYLQDRRYEEIAAVMELPIGTVKTYLHRARAWLREHVAEERCAG
jgi:RNA polymerase sigma-70 factor (ECF subfamily)